MTDVTITLPGHEPIHTTTEQMEKAATIMADTKTSFAQGQLKSLVERIERLDEDKKAISGDIKEVYAEAKANGFDTKILRKVIALRKKDRHEREEEEAILDLYLSALGMQPSFDFAGNDSAE
jgi:uncharacterized protein (UPF0335 family)